MVPSSNLGPGTIIKRLKGAFLMPNQNIDAFSGFLVHQGTKRESIKTVRRWYGDFLNAPYLDIWPISPGINSAF